MISQLEQVQDPISGIPAWFRSSAVISSLASELRYKLEARTESIANRSRSPIIEKNTYLNGCHARSLSGNKSLTPNPNPNPTISHKPNPKPRHIGGSLSPNKSPIANRSRSPLANRISSPIANMKMKPIANMDFEAMDLNRDGVIDRLLIYP